MIEQLGLGPKVNTSNITGDSQTVDTAQRLTEPAEATEEHIKVVG